MSLLPFLLLALAAAGTTALLTPVAIACAQRWGWLDHPRGRKDHAAATPLLGGLALVGAWIAVPAVGFALARAGLAPTEWADWTHELRQRSDAWLWWLGGVGVAAAAGLWDDLAEARPGPKLLLQGLAAAAPVLGGGVALSWAPWGWLDLLGAWLWIVAAMNAFNWLDNMNGVLSGIAAAVALPFFALAFALEQYAVAAVLALLVGSCLAFLPFNFPRARIFLGDAGSQSIGLLLGALSVQASYRAPETRFEAAPWLVPPALLALPLLDLVAVVVARSRAGAPIARGDHRHLSFRLARRLGGRARAAVACWLLAFAFSALASLLPWCGPFAAAGVLGGQALLFGLAGPPVLPGDAGARDRGGGFD